MSTANMKFNVYWRHPNGEPRIMKNMNLTGVHHLTTGILLSGGEITGIIDSEKD